MNALGRPAPRYVGSVVPRIEDERLLTGRGIFVDDVDLPGMLHAAFARSPLPHARITRLDVEAARQAPGVVAILTGADLADLTEPIRSEAPVVNHKVPPFHALATDKVRLVGDPVVMVVATSRALAEDAAEMVALDLAPLPAVLSAADAVDPALPALFTELDGNICSRASFDYGDVDAEFARAAHIVRCIISTDRVANAPMETRGVVADYDPRTRELTIHACAQSPHFYRNLMADLVRHEAHLIHVRVRDVGGSFGLKATISHEDIAVVAMSMLLGRPVKWTEDRRENLVGSGHARGDRMRAQAAVDADGVIRALEIDLTIDQGAYPAYPLPAAVFGLPMRIMIPGPTRMKALRFSQMVVTTNKSRYVAYRGPWATETIMRETLIDTIAARLDLDPVAVRRANIMPLTEQPTNMVTGPTLAHMTAELSLDAAVARMGYDDFRKRQSRARSEGRYLGIGFSTFIEPAPGPPNYRTAIGATGNEERAYARLEPDGQLTVTTAQAPHGQSLQTTLSQVAADALGTSLAHITVVYGDTDRTPFSQIGTGGSRSATLATGAVKGAASVVREKVLAVAGFLLEADPGDLELSEGVVSVQGSPDASLSLRDVARRVYFAPGSLPAKVPHELEADFSYTPDESGWAIATHSCEVELDPNTGRVKIARYVVAEDCGSIINPAVVDGQVRGGTVQGISQALLELTSYSHDGYPLNTSLSAYPVPNAIDAPEIEIIHLETPPVGSVNSRGVGEGGGICAPAAVLNAVNDALSFTGLRLTHLPVRPQHVRQAMRQHI